MSIKLLNYRKAEEFFRMLDARGQASLKQLNLVGDAKLFICLECAAVELGQSFDKVRESPGKR